MIKARQVGMTDISWYTFRNGAYWWKPYNQYKKRSTNPKRMIKAPKFTPGKCKGK